MPALRLCGRSWFCIESCDLRNCTELYPSGDSVGVAAFAESDECTAIGAKLRQEDGRI
jgi:hypothetical protein